MAGMKHYFPKNRNEIFYAKGLDRPGKSACVERTRGDYIVALVG